MAYNRKSSDNTYSGDETGEGKLLLVEGEAKASASSMLKMDTSRFFKKGINGGASDRACDARSIE